MDDTSRRVNVNEVTNDRASNSVGADPVVKVTTEAAGTVASTGAATDPDTDRRTSHIRQEIEQTREEMSETIDAIQEKLSPRNIVAHATDRVKTATTERIREMAGTAGDKAQDVINQTRDTAGGIVETVQHNPIPAALIGFGAAWLLMNRSGSDGGYRQQRAVRSAVRYDRPYLQDDGGGFLNSMRSNPLPVVLASVGLGWLAYSGGNSERSRGGSTYGRYYSGDPNRWSTGAGTSQAPGGSGESTMASVSDSAERLASRAKDYAGDAGEALQHQGRWAQNQLQRMLEDSPLLVGAGALMIGAAFGLAVPETETENEWMGEARDTVVERTQEMARNAASQVQVAASSIVDKAGQSQS